MGFYKIVKFKHFFNFQRKKNALTSPIFNETTLLGTRTPPKITVKNTRLIISYYLTYIKKSLFWGYV